jgi:hypothetical protein
VSAPKWVVLQPWTCHCGQANLGPAPCSACLNAAPPGIAAAPAPEPPRRHPWLRAIALLTAVLLVAGVGAAFLVDGERRQVSAGGDEIPPEGRTIEVGPDSEPAAGAGELERALPGLLRFTQEARGLPFTAPVKVTLLPDKAFRARLAAEKDEETEESREELETTQRILEALGLLDKGIDLEKAIDSLYGAAVAGFYDPETDDLVVRGERLTVGVRTTLVHELVHALQDQHFDIERDELDDRDDEASTGFAGLVEGDAVRIERLYLDSLTGAERKQAELEELAAGSGIDPDLPRILLQLVAFPYLAGPEFVTAVFEAGGQERLDAAYADPPTTSEQLMHPELFLQDPRPVEVDAPETDGGAEAIDEGVMGELILLLVLNESGVSGQRAAAGWGADRYVAWRDGDDTCFRVNIAMDTPQDDAELRQALQRLDDERDGFDWSGRGPFTFTACG